MPKVDLHTHSAASPDGGIKTEQYRDVLQKGLLDCIAVTDHNRLDLAQKLQAELGDKIIVGEEIATSEGELIGLFLKEVITAGQSAKATAKAIKAQGGLVYVPHPLEKVRSGVSQETLNQISELIDVVEVCNGRAIWRRQGARAANWAKGRQIAAAASSDAHGFKGLGYTYSQLAALPTSKTLVNLLDQGSLITGHPPVKTLLYPKANRLHKKLREAS